MAGPPAGRPLPVRVSGPRHPAVLMLPDGDHITVAVQRTGTYYERDLLDAIRSAKPRGVFVDVGAHHGNHTAYFALECDAERVIAIEPSEPAFAALGQTVAANGLTDRVVPHRIAVHPHWRRVRRVPDSWRPRSGSPARGNTGAARFAPDPAGDVPASGLDEILFPAGAPFRRRIRGVRAGLAQRAATEPRSAARSPARATRPHSAPAGWADTDAHLDALHTRLGRASHARP